MKTNNENSDSDESFDSSDLLCCVSCSGDGKSLAMFPVYAPDFKGERKSAIETTCDRCNGSGEMPREHSQWISDGYEMKQQRLKRRMTLRSESKQRGIKPSELSKMERGIIKPIQAT